jgi:hypothetical protein
MTGNDPFRTWVLRMSVINSHVSWRPCSCLQSQLGLGKLAPCKYHGVGGNTKLSSSTSYQKLVSAQSTQFIALSIDMQVLHHSMNPV